MHAQIKAITLLLALYAGGSAGMESPKTLASVPDTLRPGSNESLSLVVPARGVQIYECLVRKDQPGEYEWAFVAPEAELFDGHDNRIGKHYGGPHWEAADGSRIVGIVKERAEAPAPDAIPWLLLTAKSVGPEGSFSKVTSIQRVNTVSGVAPRTGCTQAAAGATVRVKYSADYYFFTVKRSN
jgi:hypothetical protein